MVMAENRSDRLQQNRAETVAQRLQRSGLSRRGFVKFCSATAAVMSLPPSMVPAITAALGGATHPSVMWLSFQDHTGCAESFTRRTHNPTIESLVFEAISLDYHHLLQAAAGDAARASAMAQFKGKYLVMVDGSIPVADGGIGSTVAAVSNIDMLQNIVENAAAVISVGSCATLGGRPNGDPNPSGAVGVDELMEMGKIATRPLINVPGCPPNPLLLTGIVAHYLTLDTTPELDHLHRPRSFYGDTIHDRCYRRTFYDQGKFAETFDDEGARRGWCLFRLGCIGPITHNSATTQWSDEAALPIDTGDGYIEGSEPTVELEGMEKVTVGAGVAGGSSAVRVANCHPRSWSVPSG